MSAEASVTKLTMDSAVRSPKTASRIIALIKFAHERNIVSGGA